MVDVTVGEVCNNSCIMCTTIRANDKKVNQRILSFDEIKNQVKEDPEYISITGGEPTISPDLPELISYLRNSFPETEIKLLSNGRRFSYEKYCDQVVSAGVSKIIIPLHAHCWELHDFITRTKNSFEQTIQGIRNVVDKINIEVRIVVHGLNYPFIPETVELVRSISMEIPIVILYFDMIGSAFLNKKRLAVEFSKVVPFIERSDLGNCKLYHFPICVLSPNIRKYAEAITVKDIRIGFPDACAGCVGKQNCPGVWKTYLNEFGSKEFRALR